MSSRAEPQPVDFRKPRRMAASARQAVSDWYTRSVTRTAENWQLHIAEPPQITHSGSEVMLVRDALQQLTDPGWGCVLRIGPEAFTTLFCIPLRQILLLVNAMIGAVGEDWPNERPLTAVEEELARLIINDLARGLADGWPGRMQLAVRAGDVESRPARSRIFAPRTQVYMSTFRIKQPLGEVECQWILPEDDLAELVARSSEESAARAPTVNHAIMNHLARQMPVGVVVELGQVALTMSQLSRLDVGDVLVLGQCINDSLLARVGDEVKFRGWAGRAGIRRGFQVSTCIHNQ